MKGTEKQIMRANRFISKAIKEMESFISLAAKYIESGEALIRVDLPRHVDLYGRKKLEIWKEALERFKTAEFETAAEVIAIEKSCGWRSYFSKIVADIEANPANYTNL